MNERILFIKLDPETEDDIIRWMKSLPTRTVNKTVNEIVVAESRGQTARIPYKISYTKEVEPRRCRLIFKNNAAINFLSKIPNGEYKSTLVKIIRRHIERNENLPPAPFEVNIKYFSMAVDCFVKTIKSKRWEARVSQIDSISLTHFMNSHLKIFLMLFLNATSRWIEIKATIIFIA